jgi:hypothetical protein
MPGTFAKAALLTMALIAATSADAQTRRNREPREAAPPPVPAVPLDKRDSVVAVPGAFNGKPYWLALAQCGGAYFKLNVFYTDIATRARVKPDPKTATEYTKKLTDAIKTGTMCCSAKAACASGHRACRPIGGTVGGKVGGTVGATAAAALDGKGGTAAMFTPMPITA